MRLIIAFNASLGSVANLGLLLSSLICWAQSAELNIQALGSPHFSVQYSTLRVTRLKSPHSSIMLHLQQNLE